MRTVTETCAAVCSKYADIVCGGGRPPPGSRLTSARANQNTMIDTTSSRTCTGGHSPQHCLHCSGLPHSVTIHWAFDIKTLVFINPENIAFSNSLP